jgi:hypothetical protein
VDIVCEAHILDILAHELRRIFGDLGIIFYVVVGFYMLTHVDLGYLCGPSLMMMMMYQ